MKVFKSRFFSGNVMAVAISLKKISRLKTEYCLAKLVEKWVGFIFDPVNM